MPIFVIGTDNYDSDLLSNDSTDLLIELAELDIQISQLQQYFPDLYICVAVIASLSISILIIITSKYMDSRNK